MRFPSIGVLLACLLTPAAGLAQDRPLLDAARAAFPSEALPGPDGGGAQASNVSRDSVLDGVFIGAGVGAAGAAVGVWAWCQGDYKGSCDDEPGVAPMAGWAALIGAGAGALAGWVIDLNRSPRPEAEGHAARGRAPSLVVAPVALPSHTSLQVTLRY